MTSETARCLFSEGSVALPEGYQDRTVNIFPPPAAGDAAFNISRDTPEPNEALADYIERQLGLMKTHLKGWKTLAREAVRLGHDGPQGECLHASYMRGAERIWQRQAVFLTGPDKVLVFTLSKNTELSAQDEKAFSELLASFHSHPQK
jgi:hypothetical protein